MTPKRLSPEANPYARLCYVCSKPLSPFYPQTLTAHEFQCYEASGTCPDYHREAFERAILHKRRSEAAFRAVETRKARKSVKMPEPCMVRVIRDVRDGRLDYLMPKHEARDLFLDGRLVLLNVYSGRWDYAEPQS